MNQWKQFKNNRDDISEPNYDYEPWCTEKTNSPKGYMKMEIFCPVCGKKIKVTFRKPFSTKDNLDKDKKFHAKARFCHCNGISVKMEIHGFDARYKDELIE